MKIIGILFTIFLFLTVSGSALAVGPGKSIEYPDGEQGKVIFKGDTHGMKQGMKCNDCHPSLFGMKKGEFKMTQEGHADTTKGCGVCHNGEKAFSQTDPESCGKCHKASEELSGEAMNPEETPEEIPQNTEGVQEEAK